MRQVKHLNFNWQYCPNFKPEFIEPNCDQSDFELVHLPHSNCEIPYNNFDETLYQFESVYRQQLFVEQTQQGKAAILHFEGVMNYAKVYVNGRFVGEHKGGYTPFSFDISPFLTYEANNLIAVYVDSSERKEIPPFGFIIDYLTYGGIYREVRLEFCDQVSIENCHVRTRNVLTAHKSLDLDVYLNNYAASQDPARLQCRLLQSENVLATFSHDFELSGQQQQLQIKQAVADVQLWDTDTPHLYTLEITLLINDTKCDLQHYRFGFRQVEFKSNGFFLNGQRLKLQGVNRHQSFPYVGYAMPKSAQQKDVEILKYELGLNAVRLSHYPQSQHFLDRCDELGLLVFDEIPGWQHIGEEGEWWDITRQHVNEMIKRSWNHPSIFIWGVRINESIDCDKLYQQTNEIAKRLDDTRPTGGVRCCKNSNLIEDVYTYNDFVHNGNTRALDKPKDVTGGQVPYLVSEHNGHMFPTKRFDSQEQRLEHALRHLRVLDAMHADDNISGAFGWCMFDYNTHKDFGSGDRICYHGVLDMFRIPKYAAAVYASQQDHTPYLDILSNMRMGDYPGSEMSDVHVFTNCEHIKLYKNDIFIQDFYPARDLYPNLSHPPIIIDNFIGDLIEQNEPFSYADCRMLKGILIEITRVGMESLPLKSKLKMLYLLKKNKMTMADGTALYGKYIGGWGDESTTFRVDGYLNNQLVCSKNRGQSRQPRIDVQIDSNTLVEAETYDCTRVVVQCLDEDNAVMPYANDVINLETNGPIMVIGPTQAALIGGAIAFWIKTTGQTGEASVTVRSARSQDIRQALQIIKQDEV